MSIEHRQICAKQIPAVLLFKLWISFTTAVALPARKRWYVSCDDLKYYLHVFTVTILQMLLKNWARLG